MTTLIRYSANKKDLILTMDTTILIILIGCATVIALAAIVCDFLYKRKINEIPDNKVVKIHRNYIAGILAFAIVMLLTSNYGCSGNEIFSYLSFASTITSLVLSILAIFVTVKSSSDLYKNFSRMDDATHTITTASEKVEGSLNALKNAEKSLQNASAELSSKFDNIIAQITEKVQETETHISNKFEDTVNRLSENSGLQQTKLPDDNLNVFKSNYLKLSSATGLLCIYTSTLSFEKQKSFEINVLFKNNETYTLGYLISAVSSGVISFNCGLNGSNAVICTSSIFKSDEFIDELKERIEQLDAPYKKEFKDSINSVNSFFGVAAIV